MVVSCMIGEVCYDGGEEEDDRVYLKLDNLSHIFLFITYFFVFRVN